MGAPAIARESDSTSSKELPHLVLGSIGSVKRRDLISIGDVWPARPAERASMRPRFRPPRAAAEIHVQTRKLPIWQGACASHLHGAKTAETARFIFHSRAAVVRRLRIRLYTSRSCEYHCHAWTGTAYSLLLRFAKLRLDKRPKLACASDRFHGRRVRMTPRFNTVSNLTIIP